MLKLGKIAKQTFNRYKRRAQAKINRLKKKGINIDLYLDFSLKPEFKNKKEYNAWKKKIDNFTDRFNTDFKVKTTSKGVKYIPYEEKLLKELTLKSNTMAREKREHLLNTTMVDRKGNDVGTLRDEKEMLRDQEIGFVREVSPLTVEDLPHRNVIEKRILKLQERSNQDYFDKRNEQMRENYISLMEMVYHNEADDLIKMVRDLPIDDFVEFYTKHRDFQFAWYDSQKGTYLGPEEEDGDSLGELYTSLKNWNSNKGQRDLKAFR